jgi:hypothetical protein
MPRGWPLLFPKAPHQENDQADQQNQPDPAATVNWASIIKSASAEQKDENHQNQY